MKLLLSRKQTYSQGIRLVPLKLGDGYIFELEASIELEQEEQDLLDKYKLNQAALVTSDMMEDIKKSFRPALVLGIVTFIGLWFIIDFNTAGIMAAGLTTIMTIIYYRAFREAIYVSDLIGKGRVFVCDSVVTLIEKENDLERICQFLRQVIESAKHWNDREAIDIQPLDKSEVKQAILKAVG